MRVTRAIPGMSATRGTLGAIAISETTGGCSRLQMPTLTCTQVDIYLKRIMRRIRLMLVILGMQPTQDMLAIQVTRMCTQVRCILVTRGSAKKGTGSALTETGIWNASGWRGRG